MPNDNHGREAKSTGARAVCMPGIAPRRRNRWRPSPLLLGRVFPQALLMSDDRSAVLEFVATAAHARAAHYRDQAAQLRDMAAAEPIGRLRDRLLDLAAQYDRLAEALVLGNASRATEQGS